MFRFTKSLSIFRFALSAFRGSDATARESGGRIMDLDDATGDAYSVEAGMAGNNWFAVVLHMETLERTQSCFLTV